MRLRVQIGAVMIDWSGADLTPRHVKALIDQCADRNAAIDPEPDETPEPDRTRIGFAAPVLDKAEPLPPPDYYDD